MFLRWLQHHWGKHIYAELLQPLYDASALKNAGKAQLLQKIYLFGNDEQFADITDRSALLKAWDAAALQVTVLPLETFSGTAKLCLEWLRLRLTRGRLFAAPIDTLRIMAYTSYTKHREEACQLNDILALVSCEQLLGSQVELRKLTFFKVVNAFPNRRTVRHAYHLGARPTVVAIIRYDIDRHTDSTVRLRPAFSTEYLDLNFLASCRFSDFIQSFWTFHSIQYGSKPDIMPKALRLLAESPVPLPLPWSESKNPSALMPRETDFVTPAHKFVCQLLGAEHSGSLGQLVDIASLGSYCSETVESLERAGVIKTRRSAHNFAVEAIGISFSAVRYVPLVMVGAPALEFTIASQAALATQSRLDLAMLLYRQGFTATYDAPRYWDESSQEVFRAQALLSGTKLYFVALVLRHEIARRGGFVMHTGSARYYHLLLTLKDHAVFECLKDADAAMPEELLQTLSATDSLHEPLLPIQYSEEPIDEPNGDVESDRFADSSDLLTEPLPILIQKYAAETAQLRSYQHGGSIIYFDNRSHSSGKLRAFTKCRLHDRCTKHMQVETAGSRHLAICHLMAWLQWAEVQQLERDDHSGHAPPAALVDHFASTIPASA